MVREDSRCLRIRSCPGKGAVRGCQGLAAAVDGLRQQQDQQNYNHPEPVSKG